MLFGKDLNRKSVRSAASKARSMSKAENILSLFKVEFFTAINHEQHFYIGEVRANNMDEAVTLLHMYAQRRGGKSYSVHRKYDLGKDRSWLYGNKNYKVQVLEVKMFDHALYEAYRKREAI